jgi:hypothetical protein
MSIHLLANPNSLSLGGDWINGSSNPPVSHPYCSFSTWQQALVVDTRCPIRKRRRWPSPFHFIDIGEERRVGSQRRERSEQQRAIALSTECLRRK